ncbi:MAG: sn-glycerol-1-phosphate dehydrogenase [Actinomycetaceae bacterium]|nr:sn-glycerol-1-phosphate dehydrogenase [Actinomycetaceae bacterium]
MTSTRITKALAHATDTRRIEIGSGILSCTGPLFVATTGAPEAMIIADETTWKLAGAKVRAALISSGIALAEPLIFPAEPPVYAGYENVTLIRRRLLESGATACSIGSGTISDLVKLASGELSRPYVHVCTAASMDGYAAFGAAISRDGFKITRACPAPTGIIADLDVIATAPPMMTANGYADLTEKFTGGADWIIADALGIEPIAPFAWGLVQDGLREALARPAAARAGERGALEGLVEEAMLAGLAIQAAQSSRPGSGVGHNFSHQWEMEGYGLDWPLPLSHGAKVGIGTIAIAAVYDAVLNRDFADVDAAAVAASWPTPQENEARVRSLQDIPAIADAAVEQAAGKYIAREAVPARVASIQKVWPEIRARLRSQVPPATEIRDMLRAVGATYHPAMMGISLEKLRRTYYQAQTIRSRYAILDVLFETGTLDDVVDSLFAPGGFWAEEPVPAESIVP